MSTFVESLKRLYIAGSVDDVKLKSLKDAGKINSEELAYIKS